MGRISYAKTEKEKRIEKFFINLITFYTGSSLILLIVYGCGHEIGIALLFLTLPLFIILIIIDRKYKFFFCCREDCKGYICRIFSITCRVFVIVTCSILFSFSSAGYISFFNSVLPPQKTFYYSGRVVDKIVENRVRYNRFNQKDYIIILHIEDRGEEKFSVSYSEFYKIKKNQFYKIKMREGGLGIVCRAKNEI
jgi:hypothetical protein